MNELIYHFNGWAHVGLGFTAIAGGLVALVSTKGSRIHRRGGWVFAGLMLPVALTTLIMMFHEFLPLAIVLATAEFYLVPAALLSINRDMRGFKACSIALVVLVSILMLFVTFQFVRFSLLQEQVFIGPLVLAAMFGFLVVQDLHMLAVRPEQPNYWIRRHLVRMILAFTIAFMAIVRIGLPFGLSLEASVILPLLVATAGILWAYRRFPTAADTSPA
ncbi:hypothetical protein G4Y73_12640 [Wenzhouxiangella sp. XN201]|uniref:hypothetical protein n=1 Tax=Wenzhouxiangella sp. XN201 TaxID=2710755 RepID=UPI0013CB6E95|nr:hypothetical protein [Wenzhouxiangella sp. XN201]NEZ04998.1 hypothetical protein [Wenzhouxiangella sp. XN201]